jgi:hypothetical protein
MMQYFTAISWPVTMACTPGSASAVLASTLRIRACGCGERRILPCSMPGKFMSSA